MGSVDGAGTMPQSWNLKGKEGGAAAGLSYRALWYWIDAQESQEGTKGSAQQCKQVPLERMFCWGEVLRRGETNRGVYEVQVGLE